MESITLIDPMTGVLSVNAWLRQLTKPVFARELKIKAAAMKRAIYCGLISAVVGFVVAVWVASISPSSAPRWMSTTIAYILCPPGILAGITMTDPDKESLWLFFGPLNAMLYGAVGYTLWLFVMGDDAPSATSEKKDQDRPLGP